MDWETKEGGREASIALAIKTDGRVMHFMDAGQKSTENLFLTPLPFPWLVDSVILEFTNS